MESLWFYIEWSSIPVSEKKFNSSRYGPMSRNCSRLSLLRSSIWSPSLHSTFAVCTRGPENIHRLFWPTWYCNHVSIWIFSVSDYSSWRRTPRRPGEFRVEMKGRCCGSGHIWGIYDNPDTHKYTCSTYTSHKPFWIDPRPLNFKTWNFSGLWLCVNSVRFCSNLLRTSLDLAFLSYQIHQ